MPDLAFRVEDRRRRPRAHFLNVGVFLAGIDVTLSSRGRGDDGEPDDSLRGPLLLQRLHVSALVVLDGVWAIAVVPLEHHVLAFVLVEALGFAGGVGSVKVGCRGTDLSSAGRGGGGEGED